MFGHSIYGPIGIVIAEVFFTLPHAIIILVTSLSIADARLYEAAVALRASRLRIFLTVTLPGCRYGLISAAFVVFTLSITDFGAPKVIGGDFNVLATDVYKQVIGQQNFEMGAVVSVVLLIPAVLAFAVDRVCAAPAGRPALLARGGPGAEAQPHLRRRDARLLHPGERVPDRDAGYVPVRRAREVLPLRPELRPAELRLRRDGRRRLGRVLEFDSPSRPGPPSSGPSWSSPVHTWWRRAADSGPAGLCFQFLAMMPMAVPGLVLGLAYIFFFNHPDNPLGFLYHTMAIPGDQHHRPLLHRGPPDRGHRAQADGPRIRVGRGLAQGAPFYKTFWRVTVPVCLPAILDIMIYLFVNAMTTVSAVVFIYGPDTNLASVAVLNMDDAGDIAPAAAMGMMIFYTAASVRLAHFLASKFLQRRTQAWRMR